MHTCTLKTGNRNTKHVFQLVKWLTPESARQISVFMGISEIITWTKLKKKLQKSTLYETMTDEPSYTEQIINGNVCWHNLRLRGKKYRWID